MAEEEKWVSINDVVEIFNKEGIDVSAQTVKQMCENGQIPPDAYVIYDKGTMVETWLFCLSKVKAAAKKAKTTKK